MLSLCFPDGEGETATADDEIFLGAEALGADFLPGSADPHPCFMLIIASPAAEW